jgi:uncharacterized protein involved in exopolysaccharide biosynthesis
MDNADDHFDEVRETGRMLHGVAPTLESSIRELRAAHDSVAADVALLMEQVAALRSEMEELRRQLGV